MTVRKPLTDGAAETDNLKEFLRGAGRHPGARGGLPRPDTELEAARISAIYVRNRRFLWASLRAALADYHALLVLRCPTGPGTVDALPPWS